jgi:hypothetical protein
MLEGAYLPRNHAWPRGWRDFDRLWPTTDLVLRADTEARSEWSPSRAHNLIGLGVSLVTLGAGAAAWLQRERLLLAYEAASPGVKLMAWGFVAGWALVTLLCLAMACFRSRLIIDRQRGELRVLAWGRVRDAVPLSSVRLLSHENVRQLDNDEGSAFAHELRPVLVMELRDGTLIRVTAGRPQLMGELRLQITAAHEQWCGGHRASDDLRSPGHATDQARSRSRHAAVASARARRGVREPPPARARVDHDDAAPAGEAGLGSAEEDPGLPLPEREAALAACIEPICRESFPDDGDATWSVVAMRHCGAFTAVEAYPVGRDLGYERFRFVFECPAGGKPLLRACFVDQRGWTVLFGVDPGIDFAYEEPACVSPARRP